MSESTIKGLAPGRKPSREQELLAEIAELRGKVDLVFDNCRVIYFHGNGLYPLEHNPHAKKDSRLDILRALAAMQQTDKEVKG